MFRDSELRKLALCPFVMTRLYGRAKLHQCLLISRRHIMSASRQRAAKVNAQPCCYR